MSKQTLLEKAQQIQAEKNEKIIPENFDKDLTIFGVKGNITYLGGKSGSSDIEEYNPDTGTLTLGVSSLASGKHWVDDNTYCTIDISGYYILNTILGVTNDMIKYGVDICGMVGTYRGDTQPVYDYAIRDLGNNLSEFTMYRYVDGNIADIVFNSMRIYTDSIIEVDNRELNTKCIFVTDDNNCHRMMMCNNNNGNTYTNNIKLKIYREDGSLIQSITTEPNWAQQVLDEKAYSIELVQE